MRTYTGRYFDPKDPQPDMISIVDIAQGLAQQARFCGQLEVTYSVAEHCVMVSWILVAMGYPKLALKGLLHDAHEAFTSDIPSPIKEELKPLITAIEERFDKAIYAKFGLGVPTTEEHAIIKTADNFAFYVEDRDLRGATVEDFDYAQLKKFPQFEAVPVGSQQAKIMYMERFLDLLDTSV